MVFVALLGLWSSWLSAGLTKDGSVEYSVPAGFSEAAVTRDALQAALELRDAAGSTVWLRTLPDRGELGLDIALYEELKVVETRTGLGCAAGPMRVFELGAGATARGVEGRCGGGPGAREYGALLSVQEGQALLVSAAGQLTPAVRLLANARSTPFPTVFHAPRQGKPSPLPPLPRRTRRGRWAVALLAVLAAVQGASWVLRLFPRPEEDAPVAAGSPFPVRIEPRRERSGGFAYAVIEASGNRYTATSEGDPIRIQGWTVALLVLALIQAAVGAEPMTIWRTLGIAGAVLGAALLRFRRHVRQITVHDKAGNEWLRLVEAGPPRGQGKATAIDMEGWELYRLRRRREGGLRRWDIVSLNDEVLLEFSEVASRRASLRPILGHLWGRLRAEFVLRHRGEAIGSLKRRGPMGRYLAIDMDPLETLDHRHVIAAALFIERVDPDRWHPWPA